MPPTLRAPLAALATGAAFAVAYCLLRQDITHEYDVYWMLPRLRDGELVYARHPLALPVADLWLTLLDGLGSLHDRLRLANGVSSGVAVGLWVLAAHVWTGRLRLAVAAGVLFGALPATVRFATVAELHGLFLPFATAALWPAAVLATRGPTARRGAALGVATGVASGMHATAHLLVCAASAWLVFAQWRRAGRRPVAVAVAAALVAHVAVNLVLRALIVPADAVAPAATQWHFLADQPLTLDGGLDLLLGEYLRPLLPVSLLWPVAALRLGRRAAGPLALTLLGSLPVYLAVCQTMLTFPGHGYVLHEYGAYQLPLAALATLLCVRGLGRPALLAAAAVAIAMTGYDLLRPHRRAPDPAFGAAAERYLETHDVRLLVGDHAEFDGLYERLYEHPARDAVRARLILLDQLVYEHIEHEGRVHDVTPEQLAFWLANPPTVLTDRALARMRAMGGDFQACVEGPLERLFAAERVDDGPLHGVLLRAR